MKIIILAHGRINKGPEFELISKYVTRFNKHFSKNFLSSLKITESSQVESQFNERVENMLELNQTMVLLDRKGEHFDSEGFTQFLTLLSQKGVNEIFFVIGGAEGFPTPIILKAKKLLSLSKMVLPHKIARLVLVEQLYRAKCIIHRHPYHKV